MYPTSRSRVLLAGLVVGLALSPALSMAQPPAPARPGAQAGPFGVLRWRSLGPLRGGRSIAAQGTRGAPERVLLRRHRRRPVEDHGRRYDLEARDRRPDQFVLGRRDRHRGQSNPDVVYIGMGETDIRGNIAQGDGVYKTTDGGKTWKHIGPRRHPRGREDPGASDESGPRLRRRPRHIRPDPTMSAASSARRTAAPPGRRSSSRTTRPARSS